MMIKNNQILAGTETCFLSAGDVFYLYLLPLFHLYALCSLLFAIYIKKNMYVVVVYLYLLYSTIIYGIIYHTAVPYGMIYV